MIDLLGIDAVCDLAGIHRDTLLLHRSGKSRTPFPEPTLEVQGHPVWERSIVEEWLRTPRKRGRPPATDA